MALLVACTCKHCHKGFQGVTSHSSRTPDECSECHQARIDMERREHFGGLDALSVEERLRRIETWIYDYRPPRTGPATYGS